MKVKKEQLEPDMEQQTVSKSGKEHIRAVYSHPANVTYTEYIMCNVGLDKAQAGIKTAREISITSDTQVPQSLRQKAKRN